MRRRGFVMGAASLVGAGLAGCHRRTAEPERGATVRDMEVRPMNHGGKLGEQASDVKKWQAESFPWEKDVIKVPPVPLDPKLQIGHGPFWSGFISTPQKYGAYSVYDPDLKIGCVIGLNRTSFQGTRSAVNIGFSDSSGRNLKGYTGGWFQRVKQGDAPEGPHEFIVFLGTVIGIDYVHLSPNGFPMGVRRPVFEDADDTGITVHTLARFIAAFQPSMQYHSTIELVYYPKPT